MAKSLRSKREKRLRAIRREIVEPLYEPMEAAKFAAQEAAMAAPKLPVRSSNPATTSMDIAPSSSSKRPVAMEIERIDGSQIVEKKLKPSGGVGKKLKKKLILAKKKKGRGNGKGKIRRTHI